tara:strand:- start:121 stop:306 length:186 start_codon:yes stop_codon:yes gene_type:complete
MSFFKWRGGVNTIQIIIILGAYYVGNNILVDSGWEVFFKLIALVFFVNLSRTTSWWLKGYP